MQEALKIYEFYVFDRSGKPLLERNYMKGEDVQDEKSKLVYGVLFSLKQMIPALSPPEQLTEEGIRSLTTRAFTMHAYESPTGFRFALVTSPASSTQQAAVRTVLEKIYAEHFVELVMLDPTCKPGMKITSHLFMKYLQETLQTVGIIDGVA